MDKIATTKSGIVLVNKPVGISSNKVVNIVKYVLKARKCGHLGTLDLEGRGLLPVCVNNATKLFNFFLDKDKTYQTTFVFGFETDTLDTSGQIVKEKECDISRKMVEEVLPSMIGKYLQMPPQYSAKKINGQTAYKVARSGGEVELKPKEVEIYDIKLLRKLRKNTFKLEISCSSGTYIRSVCRDLATKLSTYGSMQCITRTRCGTFKLEDTISLRDVKNGKINLISCDILFDYPSLQLDFDTCSKLYIGQILKTDFEEGRYKIYNEKDFIGIGHVEDKLLKLDIRL